MEISIGATVVGRDGKLGEVSRLVFDRRAERVESLVVKESRLFGRERVVPLSDVSSANGEDVAVDLDRDGLEGMIEYDPEAFRGPERNYVAPPAAEGLGMDRVDYAIDLAAVRGIEGNIESKPAGYPGGEGRVSEDRQPVVVERGLDVLDVNGEKAGEVGDVSIDSTTGRPTRVRLRQGIIFKNEVDIPVAWLESIATSGITLNVSHERVEELDRAA